MSLLEVVPAFKHISILIAEDSMSQRYILNELLTSMGLNITSSTNGNEAFSKFNSSPTDIVITDWNMPGMCGPDLCKKLKQHTDTPYIIMLTSNIEDEHKVTGIESGADDYIVKPYRANILKVRILAAVRLIKMQRQLRQKNEQLQQMLEKEHAYLKQIQQDLDSAARLQQALLPHSPHLNDDWEIATKFQPASDLAGDIFQCMNIDDTHIGFYLLDVTGHGVAASMQSFTLAQRLASDRCPWGKLDPSLIVNELNQEFEDPESMGRFATLILGILNTKTSQVKITNAGHPDAIIIDDQNTQFMGAKSQLPIGISKENKYQSQDFILDQKQKLLVYSDGLYECVHPTFGMFGQERLCQLCRSANALSANLLLNHINHAVTLWQGNSLQDDISMMILSPKNHNRNRKDYV
ncbi:SpoIIE family protein phosphatase [Shewanella surugensis]|uniref:SpoIIE family protein phosphatase n=1 Tax=Shewanella surugensis TaxID=212020 RepID=A0ABT0LB64_9GAMM|nr:SpoIIE family protein phosphatase [Shewanella surugensis]MCL1124912.1 SpoIIE family protein phosphatase [Shewanella surugensis]